MIALDLPAEFYGIVSMLVLAWLEYCRHRDDGAARERIAALEVRVEVLTGRADAIDELLDAADEDEKPEPPTNPAGTRARKG